MFCYQCQEAMQGKGCALAKGVCGKQDTTADLQDLLTHTLKGIGAWATEARNLGLATPDADRFVVESLFASITNANFDDEWFINAIKEGLAIRTKLRDVVRSKRGSREDVSCAETGSQTPRGGEKPILCTDAALWSAVPQDFASKAKTIGFLAVQNEDIRSLIALLIFGLRGMAAYTHHAMVLGYTDDTIFAFMHKALAATTDPAITVDQLTALVLECGTMGVTAMALLDKANTSTYGEPEITTVDIGVRNNPGILISGHDLKDLEMLLEQTKDLGIDIYTHSEMLPAHYYPAFKKYSHFAGNYGNAWWKQREEFEKFNGPILMTTNCLVPPADSYKDRVYTTGIVSYPGLKHIDANTNGYKDFTPIIEAAKRCLPPTQLETGSITGGFAHGQVMKLADKIVDAIKSGKIKKFVVMAGCDGRMASRKYYEEFALALPKDTVILTAGCAKYRYNKLNLGDIDGIPRVLDAGQCNDSYSLAVTALKLKEVFALADVNDLPLVFNIAWYEQKAVLVLLALLALGFKNIHIGPTLPAFLSPAIANVLIKTFGLGTISNVQNDITQMIG
ncbi:MAG TPA: hydroxylamine reductase [Spirochaetia bacterium]|mgnify:CR=1 FL=1|nr:hydroxylamine reductase [Spirochaetales bacterium]HQK35206.1 hydroxylamine reductase [Spirochaetales bacterium]HRS65207.1 hydroxylamine reductase [Spirochaetia bacterium]HRV28251.1 hydroxylamine reductase [Spirochaetia bacterium]